MEAVAIIADNAALRQIKPGEKGSNFSPMLDHHGMRHLKLAPDFARTKAIGKTTQDSSFVWQQLWRE
jgi:hypothetical protein